MSYRDAFYEDDADRFDPPEVIHQIMQAWKSIPQDQKTMLVRYARQLWPVRGALLAQLVILAFGQIRRGIPVQTALYHAAQRLGIQQRGAATQPGMSTTQVQQYRRRQMQRLPSNRRNSGHGRRRW